MYYSEALDLHKNERVCLRRYEKEQQSIHSLRSEANELYENHQARSLRRKQQNTNFTLAETARWLTRHSMLIAPRLGLLLLARQH